MWRFGYIHNIFTKIGKYRKIGKIDAVSEMDIPSIYVFMNDCGADSDNKQVMGFKTISLYDFI